MHFPDPQHTHMNKQKRTTQNIKQPPTALQLNTHTWMPIFENAGELRFIVLKRKGSWVVCVSYVQEFWVSVIMLY